MIITAARWGFRFFESHLETICACRQTIWLRYYRRFSLTGGVLHLRVLVSFHFLALYKDRMNQCPMWVNRKPSRSGRKDRRIYQPVESLSKTAFSSKGKLQKSWLSILLTTAFSAMEKYRNLGSTHQKRAIVFSPSTSDLLG